MTRFSETGSLILLDGKPGTGHSHLLAHSAPPARQEFAEASQDPLPDSISSHDNFLFHSPTTQDDLRGHRPANHQNASPQPITGTAQVSGLITDYGKVLYPSPGEIQATQPFGGWAGGSRKPSSREWSKPDLGYRGSQGG